MTLRAVSPAVAERARHLAALALLGLLALARPTGATHLPDHRFLVVGFVTDAKGRPVADAPVAVTRLKTGLAYPTRTERDGLYFVVVHLHDEDEGEPLSISANGVTGQVRARFDRKDRRVERGTRVDIRGRTLREDRRAFATTLRIYLAR